MKSKTAPKIKNQKRQIVGISLPPQTAEAFKQEASRRNLSLKDLFQEMWSLYQEHSKDAD